MTFYHRKIISAMAGVKKVGDKIFDLIVRFMFFRYY